MNPSSTAPKESVYVHNTPKAYPAVDTQHMVIGKKKQDFVINKDFMYRLHGFPYNILKFLFKILMIILAQPVCAVRYALRIRGRKNIREYRKMTDGKAMISVCNHSAPWDTLMIEASQYFRFPEFPMWQDGAESTDGMMYRLAGGIVMPRSDIRGKAYAFRCMRDVLEEGKWLHVFPEAACWPFYPAVRNFQSGTFQLAIEKGLPILPMAVKYRAPRGIYKWFKKDPNAELRIGAPVVPDLTLPRQEAIADLCARSRLAVMHLLGIENEEENTKIREMFPTY